MGVAFCLLTVTDLYFQYVRAGFPQFLLQVAEAVDLPSPTCHGAPLSISGGFSSVFSRLWRPGKCAIPVLSIGRYVDSIKAKNTKVPANHEPISGRKGSERYNFIKIAKTIFDAHHLVSV